MLPFYPTPLRIPQISSIYPNVPQFATTFTEAENICKILIQFVLRFHDNDRPKRKVLQIIEQQNASHTFWQSCENTENVTKYDKIMFTINVGNARPKWISFTPHPELNWKGRVPYFGEKEKRVKKLFRIISSTCFASVVCSEATEFKACDLLNSCCRWKISMSALIMGQGKPWWSLGT